MTGMIRAVLLIVLALGLGACSTKFRTYDGPEVTQIVLLKSDRRLMLMNQDKVLRAYKVGLGFAPEGHKAVEGDGRTPEGVYYIDRRNPDSRYHLSIGISYPNDVDRAAAAELEKPPGGDIFIHGRGKFWQKNAPDDWTWGCIALTDRQIEDVYAMVRDGTPIVIRP